jgi:hypothetical protein
MAGTLHTAYIGDVADFVKGADKALNEAYIIRQIIRTLRDFCKETWIWREVLPKISVVDGTDSYTLSPGTDNSDVLPEVYMVDWVKYKEDGFDDDQFAFLYAWNLETEEVATSTGINAGFVETSADAPQVFYIDPDDSLIIKPIPNSNAAGTENMQVKCMLMPSLTSTTGPTWIYRDFLETIAKGVAARVTKQAAYKWYDPRISKMYHDDYRKKRNDEARFQRWGGKNRTQMHVRVNKAFSGGSSSRNWIF